MEPPTLAAIMITQMKFASVPVHDQDRALAFFTEKLGFKVATDQPMGPGRPIRVTSPGRRRRRFLVLNPEYKLESTLASSVFSPSTRLSPQSAVLSTSPQSSVLSPRPSALVSPGKWT